MIIEEALPTCGANPGVPPVPIIAAPVTVFVGPNNSGKSIALVEIASMCAHPEWRGGKVIESLRFSARDRARAKDFASELLREPTYQISADGNAQHNRAVTQIPAGELLSTLESPETHRRTYCEWIIGPRIYRADLRGRLNLLVEQPLIAAEQVPSHPLQLLFRSDEKLQEARRITKEAFGLGLVLDATSGSKMKAKYSLRDPLDENEEKGLLKASIDFHRETLPVESFGDGVAAYTGLVVLVAANDPSILFVDEPEAFLHPPLTRRLGKFLSARFAADNKQLFAATHSADFVMGCFQSGVPVNVVRLTYNDGKGTCRLLHATELRQLMQRPLFRSTGILNGLFHESVVVAESDTDRAFYAEINERLIAADPARSITDCLFVNAQNWQTEAELIAPLRRIGVPAAGIVDFDVVLNSFPDLLDACNIPRDIKTSLHARRAALEVAIRKQCFDTDLSTDELKETVKSLMKTEGIAAFQDESHREDAKKLLVDLSKYGIFVVPVGEIERWLSGLEVRGKGPSWLVRIFEAMGDAPSTTGYVGPGAGDVWDFISSIKSWTEDPVRAGMPS